jgi:hypothetical protein
MVVVLSNKKSTKMTLKTTHFPKKISIWLLKRKWLWIATKVPFTTWDSMDIDKKVTYYKGYKHFIFRGCIACNKLIDDKNFVLKFWFSLCNERKKL